VPTEVIATPRADQQIAGLDRIHARAFGEFLDDLAARGCQALGYRLSGPAPVDYLCVKPEFGHLASLNEIATS
jgi:hypothetical protein